MALIAQNRRDALVGLGLVRPIFVDPSGDFRTWPAQRLRAADVAEFLLRPAVDSNLSFPSACPGIFPMRFKRRLTTFLLQREYRDFRPDIEADPMQVAESAIDVQPAAIVA